MGVHCSSIRLAVKLLGIRLLTAAALAVWTLPASAQANGLTQGAAAAVDAPAAVDCAKLQNILTTGRSSSILRMKSDWAELSSFHQDLWRAMALDPGIVPVNQVPDALQSKNLNEKLERKFEDLSNSALIQKYGLEQPFAEYVDIVSQILTLRREQKFINARALAKRGLLDVAYHTLVNALNDGQQADEGILLPVMSNETERKLKDVLAQVSAQAAKKTEVASHVPTADTAPAKAPEAANSSHLPSRGVLWGILGFIFGFPFGAVFYRAVLSEHAVTEPVATEAVQNIKRAPSADGFDFAEWLKGFRGLVAQYRKLRPENESMLKQVQPYLADAGKLYRKYYQETRESHHRGKFTDLELATNDLVAGLSESIIYSDQQCQAMIQHLAVLADAIQTKNNLKKTA